jgi:hypothetical protein
MHSYRPFLTQHRIQRLALWGLATLSWMAAVLFGDRLIAFHQLRRFDDTTLLGVKRMVVALLIERALNMLHRRRNRRRARLWRHGLDLRPRHWIRSLLGSKLRRALNHRDPATHMAQLIAVLRNLDAYAARLARRMRLGLRRLWSTVAPIASAELVLDQWASLPPTPDSS